MSQDKIDALKEQLLTQDVKKAKAETQTINIRNDLIEKTEKLHGQTEAVSNAKEAAELYKFVAENADESATRLALNLLKDALKEARNNYK